MRKSGSVIRVKTEISDERFRLLVEDNGVSVTEDTVRKIYQKIADVRKKLLSQNDSTEKKQAAALEYTVKEDENHNHFIGIENVFSRLILSFGDCEFRIYANHVNGTSVEFSVPLKTGAFQEVEE